ncbi:MAG: multidrug efflux SMR transporter [Clostridia bacterium]|nr:multidrug efflux SMR transporter [Clostridia bacterium]
MYWIYLASAIFLEVAGTTAMKLSKGLTKPVPSVLMFIFYFACFGVLSLALKKIEVGTAYAVWSGIGTSLIAVIGILFFKDALNPIKVISILLIVMGVIGLNLSGMSHS